jgi:phospholipase/carboxylesterase
MAVMTDPVSDDAVAGPAEVDLLVSRLTGTLDTLASIARALHPPLLPALAALIGDQDTGLEEAAARLRAAPGPPGPGDVAGPLGESAGLALGACAGLRAAALTPGWPGGAFRALGDYTRAVEALYPAAAALPAVGRWFLSPPRRDDAGLAERLRQPPAPGSGVRHAGNERGMRGGFSAYVPEYLDPATPAPLVVALHGGSGHGRAFLWTWIREARSRGLIVVAPTATGDTWSLADPETDIQHLRRVLAEIGSRHSIDPARMLLTGMSDGGTFTLLSGLTETSPFTHLAPVAASFHPVLMDISDPARTAGLPVYLVHGARDWMFPVDVARTARRVLSAAGARVRYREIADLSHAYPAEENDLIIDWLDGQEQQPGAAGRVSGSG